MRDVPFREHKLDRSMCHNPKTRAVCTSHLLQENLDEPLLLRAVSGKFMALASVRVELAPCLEAQNLQLWVTAVIDNVEQVDEDTPENLRYVSDARAINTLTR